MADSVFYDLADTPEEAANLTARGVLMIAIEQRIREEGWTQTEAAARLHITQPRVSDLLNGKISKFSLDALSTCSHPSALRSTSDRSNVHRRGQRPRTSKTSLRIVPPGPTRVSARSSARTDPPCSACPTLTSACGNTIDYDPPVACHHDGSKSSTEFKTGVSSGDPNCAPITLRDKDFTVHPEDVNVPEVLFAGGVAVVIFTLLEPFDAGDVGENQASIRVAVLLAGAR